LLKADLHIHTEYSVDCSTPLEKIITRCRELAINCIAVADHGTAEGALKLQKLAPFQVIVAEEILTTQGEIMGMFLKETIPSGLTPQQTIKRIRAQDGLVNIPHPFDQIRGSALKEWVIDEIADEIDIIEVLNARSASATTVEKARAFAAKRKIVQGAGSDAHSIQEIGNAYVILPEFSDKDQFLKSLARGEIFGQRSSPLVHLYSTFARVKSRINRKRQ
jgi:predicted metal-dependent phosphoesterase TrpH